MKKSERTIQSTIARGILLPAFVMLLVAALTFVSATYAWISTSVNYNVDDISMSAGTVDAGVLVSADCDNWSDSVDMAAITLGYEGSRNILPTNPIAPVSTSGQFDNGELVFYMGNTIAQTGETNATRIPTPTVQSSVGSYYAYDLFFRADRSATLYLGSGSSVTDVVSSTTPVSASARVAFVNLGHSEESGEAIELNQPVNSQFFAGYKAVEPGDIQDPRQIYYTMEDGVYKSVDSAEFGWAAYRELVNSGNLFVPDNSHVVEMPLRIWEPNATIHTASVTATGVLETRGVTGTGIIGESNTAPLDEGIVFNDLNGFRVDTTYVATVSPGYNKIRIYIWIEGQDADALTEVSNRSFSTKLNFVLG